MKNEIHERLVQSSKIVTIHHKNIQILTQECVLNFKLINIFPAIMRTYFRENKHILKKFQEINKTCSILL